MQIKNTFYIQNKDELYKIYLILKTRKAILFYLIRPYRSIPRIGGINTSEIKLYINIRIFVVKKCKINMKINKDPSRSYLHNKNYRPKLQKKTSTVTVNVRGLIYWNAEISVRCMLIIECKGFDQYAQNQGWSNNCCRILIQEKDHTAKICQRKGTYMFDFCFYLQVG